MYGAVMRIFRRAGATCVTVAAVALALGAAAPAQAATLVWRVVYSKHYGATANISTYDAVAALSKKNVWVLGGTNMVNGYQPSGSPVAVHWNGSAWASYPMPTGVTGTIGVVSAVSASDIWAATAFGGYVLHFNGTRWSVATHLPAPSKFSAGEVSGITAFSPTNVWVFGEGQGAVGALGTWHYDGKKWTEWQGDAVGLVRASALSAKDIWAIGGLTVPFGSIERFNGRTWQPVKTTALSGLDFVSIRAFSDTNVWVTGWVTGGPQLFQSMLLHYGPHSHWSKFSPPWSLDLGDISPDGRGGLWMTGLSRTGQRYAVHRTFAGAWSRYPISGFVFDQAPVPGTTSVVSVGTQVMKNGTNAVIWADGAV